MDAKLESAKVHGRGDEEDYPCWCNDRHPKWIKKWIKWQVDGAMRQSKCLDKPMKPREKDHGSLSPGFLSAYVSFLCPGSPVLSGWRLAWIIVNLYQSLGTIIGVFENSSSLAQTTSRKTREKKDKRWKIRKTSVAKPRMSSLFEKGLLLKLFLT